MRRASATPHVFPCENITTALSSTGAAVVARVLNVTKVMKELGDEGSYDFTPGLWQRAMKNMLTAYEAICAPPDPTNPLSFSVAVELAGHIKFFANLDGFEDLSLFDIWYPVECDLRSKIINESLFNLEYYEQRWNIALHNHKALVKHGLISKDDIPSKSTGLKRPAANDGNAAPPKGPRLNGGGRGRSGTPGSRGATPGGDGSGVRDRAPSCLICTGPHRASDHPADKTSFADGAALFTSPDGNDIRTARSFRGHAHAPICLVYNLNRICQAGHNDQTLHVCSLCGGNHPALSRDGSCRRVRAGAFVP